MISEILFARIILCFLIALSTIGIFYCCKKFKLSNLRSFIVTGVVLSLMLLFFVCDEANLADWNNGYCPDCNILYEIQDYTKHGQGIYECPNCHKEVTH